MPDYKETNLAGKAWNRCHEIVIENVRGTPPSVRFVEERVLELEGDQEIRQNLGPLTVSFDPAREIPLLDPATGEPTGETATYGQAYALLYSAYIAAALARDAANPPPAPMDLGNTEQPAE